MKVKVKAVVSDFGSCLGQQSEGGRECPLWGSDFSEAPIWSLA